MPRQKKDGRHINYYIDRQVFAELEAYAPRKGADHNDGTGTHPVSIF